MMRRRTSLAVAALLLAPALGHAQPQAEQRLRARGEDVYLAGPDVDVTRDVPADLVAAGGTVRVGAAVAETAILAGGNVTIDGAVGGDVIAAGGEVVLRGHAGDDARLAGGTVRIAGRVDDDAMAAGGTVRVERDAVVGGRAWLAGGEIVVAGTVGRQLRAAGGHVSIEGTVQGDVQVDADALDIGPAARIQGNVLHRGPREPRIDPGARIGGRVEHRPSAAAPRGRTFAVLAFLLLLPALFVTGGAMIVAFPRFTPAAAQTIETDPWRSLGAGVIALLGAPAARDAASSGKP
jgi:cytoskeletal protein CcmA (bactofilin family)